MPGRGWIACTLRNSGFGWKVEWVRGESGAGSKGKWRGSRAAARKYRDRMGVAAGGPAPREPVPLRRNRDFRLLWGGQAVSLLGSQTSKIAYPLLALGLTGSPAKAGIAGFAAVLGYLLIPLPAGGVADRHDRKRIMIGCDVVRLAAVGSIAVAGWAAHITCVQLLLAGFIEGTATGLRACRGRGCGSGTWLTALRVRRRSAQVGGERGQVEQVQQRVAPPLRRWPVIEMTQALVGRVEDGPQHSAVLAAGIEGSLALEHHRHRHVSRHRHISRRRLAVENRRRPPRHRQAECPG
jgi:Transmembrane secretion effector